MENPVAKAMMRTLATGIRESGFTLLELMVVLLLMGLMLGLVTLSLRSPRERPLAEDGLRLAAAMTLASDETNLTGHPVLLLLDREGWRFLDASPEGVVTIPDDHLPGGRFDPPLSAMAPVGASASDAPESRLQYWIGQEDGVVFGGWILQRGQDRVRIVTDGLGNYQLDR